MTTVQNYVNFLWKFISYDDDIEKLSEKWQLTKFIGGEINFEQFNAIVVDDTGAIRYDNIRARYLYAYANKIKENKIELKPESVQKVQKLLKDSIAPLKFEKSEGNSVIEATANNMVLSKVISHVEADEDFVKGDVKEVRVNARAILHVDVDLTKEKWHGKNFVVATDVLNVVKKPCVWNFSGKNNSSEYDEIAITKNDGDGEDGRDGYPGGSAGNVFIHASEAKGSENLKIISNGGKGSAGQTGGDGKHGCNGENATEDDLSRFDSCADTRYKRGKENYEKARDAIGTYELLLQENINEDEGRYGNSYIRAKLSNGKEIAYICFQLMKCLILVKGSEGTRGGRGGRRGLGGEGGYAGTIDIEIERNSDIQVENFKGNAGSDGEGGRFGYNGHRGCDIAKFDYVKENWFAKLLLGIFTMGIHTLAQYCGKNITGHIEKKMYGTGRNEYLKIFSTSFENDESIWCQHMASTVTVMNSSYDRENEAVKVYQERNSAKQIRERQKYAQAVKQRAINRTDVKERFKTAFAHIQLDMEVEQQVEEQTEIQMEQTIDQEVQISVNISSDNKKPPGRKPKVMEVDDVDIIEDNQLYQENLSHMSAIRYAAYDKIVQKLKMPVVGEINFSEDHELKENYLIYPKETDQTPQEILTDLNRNIKERCEYIEGLKPKPLSKYERSINIVKEFLKEVAQSSEASILPEFTPIKELATEITVEYEEFTKQNLLQRFKIIEEVELLQRFKIIEEVEQTQVMEDIQLLHEKLSALDKQEFGRWKECFENDSIKEALIKHMPKCTRDCPTFMQIITEYFSENIRYYTEDEHQNFQLQYNFNSDVHDTLYLTIVDNKFVQLTFDFPAYELDEYRKVAQNKYQQILDKVEQCCTEEEIETYLNEEVFNKNSYTSPTDSCLYNFVVASDVAFLVQLLIGVSNVTTEIKEAEELKHKLKIMVDLGAASTLHYMADRLRHMKKLNVTIRDINLVINLTLAYAAKGHEICFTLIDWILVSRSPDTWIVYLTLLRLESYFGIKIDVNAYSKWESCLLKLAICEKNIIFIFCLKLSTTERGSLDVEKVNFMFELLSECEPDPVTLSNLKLQEWSYVLKEYYWKHKITNSLSLTNYDEDFQMMVQLLLKIENKQEFQTTNALIDAFSDRKLEIDSQKHDFIDILQNFADEAWSITKNILEDVKLESDPSKWKERITNLMPPPKHTRTADELIKIIQDQIDIGKNGEEEKLKSAQKNINEIIPIIKDSITVVKEKVKGFEGLTIEDLKAKSIKIMQNNENYKYEVEELLAMVDHGVKLWSNSHEPGKGYYLRDTQKLAALIIVKHQKKTLLQVATGEGKSLIVAAAAIIRVLLGIRVDVITTSPVLAERDVDELRDLYAMFNVTVGHNTDKKEENRKTAYRNCHVVYGALASFQRDYLLDKFYNKNIMGDRQANMYGGGNKLPSICVIVDEVDSMLLDKGNSTLYLSHEIPELDKLDSIYMHIWARVVIGKTTSGKDKLLWDSDIISKEILKQLYGLIHEQDIKLLKKGMEDETAKKVLELLRQAKILDKNNFLINDQYFDKASLTSQLQQHQETQEFLSPLLLLIHQTITRERFISTPKYLKSFILSNLKRWINNATLALYLRDREDYIVDFDRHNKEVHEMVVTILDKDTGTDQANSQWDSGLHQFLQLKHGCRLTPQTLKAVFISNVSYLGRYQLLNGLSGTLGSEVERQHLVEAHNVDFLTIPTFKQKQFREYSPYVESDVTDWNKSIYDQTMKQIERNRSVLIVCETVDTVEFLFKYFQAQDVVPKELHKYTRDYEKLDVIHDEKKLTGGYVIIATNLAGRGTDLKLTDDLTAAGGLHVVVTYLAANDRIEQQALGRAARKGNPGSGQLVIFSNEFIESKKSSYRMLKLKSQRRIKEAEHVSTVRKHYDDQIVVEEKCFTTFNSVWDTNLRRLEHIDADSRKILERGILDKWAFWLDSNMPQDSKPDKTLIDKKLKEFTKYITEISTEKSHWRYWVDDLAQLIALGKCQANLEQKVLKILEYNKNISKEEKQKMLATVNGSNETAIKLFDVAIQNEPEFCEGAYYYKALTGEWRHNTKKSDWILKDLQQLPSLDKNEKLSRSWIDDLCTSRLLFEKRKQHHYVFKGLIGNLKQQTASIDSQCNVFEEQQERIIMIIDAFIKSIDDIIGHYADEELIKNGESTTLELKLAYKSLLKSDCIDSIQIDMSKFETNIFKKYCEFNGVPIEALKDFTGRGITTIDRFIEEVKKAGLNLPNREEFWEILKQHEVLVDEVTYYHLNLSEVEAFDPEFKETALSQKKVKPSKDRLYLYPELVDDSSKLLTLTKRTFKKLVPKDSLEAFENNDCFSKNQCALIDYDKLAQLIKSLPDAYPTYSGIKASDIKSEVLTENEIEAILLELENAKVLKTQFTGLYERGECFDTYQFDAPEKEIPQLYMNFMREKLQHCFSYAKAAEKLMNSKETLTKDMKLPLKPHVYEHLVRQMVACGIITKPKLKIDMTKLREIIIKNIGDRGGVPLYFSIIYNISEQKEQSQEEKERDAIKDILKTNFQQITIDDFKQFPTVHNNAELIISELNQCRGLKSIGGGQYLLDRKPNYSKMTTDTKTVRNFLDIIFNFVNENYMTALADSIYKGIGTLEQFGNEFLLVSKPLSKFTRLETKNEELQFMTNSQDEILVGDKKVRKSIGWWKLLKRILVGLIKIVIGAVLIVGTKGKIGMNLIMYGVSMIVSSVTAMLCKGESFIEKLLSSITEMAIRFMNMVNKSIFELLPSKLITSEEVQKEEEKIIQVVTGEIGKFGLANRIPKFETIVHNSMTKLTTKAVDIIKDQVTTAVTNSNIHHDLKFLYSSFDANVVDEKIKEVEDFCLDPNRFDTIMPTLRNFQNFMMDNISNMTQTLGPTCLKSLTTFEKSVSQCIDTGIETMKNKGTAVYDLLNDNILKEYKEDLERTADKINHDEKSTLLEDERQLRIDSKISGIKQALNNTIQYHFNSIKNEVQQDAKEIIITRVNTITDQHLMSLNENERLTPIDIDVDEMDKSEDLERKTVSLTEEEFKAFKKVLVVKGKLKENVQEVINFGKMQKEHFDDKKNRITKDVLKMKHQQFLKKRAQNYGPFLKVFANHHDNVDLINATLNFFIDSSSSMYKDIINKDFTTIETIFANKQRKYSRILEKLIKEIRFKPFTGTDNDLYKICIIAAIADMNKELIDKIIALQEELLPEQDLFTTELGVATLADRAIVAATHTPQQPFIWETLRVLNHIKDKKSVFVIGMREDQDVTKIPPVQMQLTKYIREGDDEEEPDTIRVHINNNRTLDLKTKEMDSALAQHSQSGVKSVHTLENDAIQLLYEFKEYLVELAEISDYCERNRENYNYNADKEEQESNDEDDFD